jgi:hypothetical protein
MHDPTTTEAPENTSDSPEAVRRDPSYPDRARIDSDVRAFLRPTSSPWIVFDRDSRVDDFAKSALRLGAVFASSPSLRVESAFATEEKQSDDDVVRSAPATVPEPAPCVQNGSLEEGALLTAATSSVLASTGVFPSSADATESSVEPSNLVVATDVIGKASNAPPRSPAADAIAPPDVRRARRAWAIAACVGIVALVGASAVAAKKRTAAKPAPRAAETTAVQVAAPPPPEPSPIALDLPEDPAPASEPAPKATVDPKKAPFGKLTIKGDARFKNVYMDGKRMLGNGQRSFLVFCGTHTIAVADKAGARDVEIPCSGEYFVSR